MTIKTVLGVLDVTKFHKDLESAITFCETHQAHLTALVVSMGAAPYVGAYDVISTVWVEERQREIEELDTAASNIKSLLEKSEISWDVQDIYTEFAWAADDIAVRALYADIVLVGPQAARDEQFRKQVIDGALFHSPTPILLNPTGRDISAAPKAVLLAWDSSDEAARAAQLSLDFLKSAGEVHVALVDPLATSSSNGEEPGADIARYLARHGVKVAVDRISGGGRPIDETLRQHAIDVSADMIVMGAYNHPRLAQRLFGGVTHSMLKEAKIPLFLAH
ncbi:universal stress protein [Rhizobium sp. Root1204]|nr:universal stress protein [Rhizobium sp. Root1204]